MRAFICDRCGKLERKDDQYYHISFKNVDSDCYLETFDLCRDCYDKVLNFIKNKKEN